MEHTSAQAAMLNENINPNVHCKDNSRRCFFCKKDPSDRRKDIQVFANEDRVTNYLLNTTQYKLTDEGLSRSVKNFITQKFIVHSSCLRQKEYTFQTNKKHKNDDDCEEESDSENTVSNKRVRQAFNDVSNENFESLDSYNPSAISTPRLNKISDQKKIVIKEVVDKHVSILKNSKNTIHFFSLHDLKDKINQKLTTSVCYTYDIKN